MIIIHGERLESYGTKTQPRKYTTPSKTTSLFFYVSILPHIKWIFLIYKIKANPLS